MKKAIGTLDYALLFFTLVACLLIMGNYFKRSVMGKYKETAESISHGQLYEK